LSFIVNLLPNHYVQFKIRNTVPIQIDSCTKQINENRLTTCSRLSNKYIEQAASRHLPE
jgi:hypothetical protein